MPQHCCKATAHLSPLGITPLLNDHWLRVEFLQGSVIFGEQLHGELIDAPAVRPGRVPGEAGGIKEHSVLFIFQKQSPRVSLSAEEKECHPHSYREDLELNSCPTLHRIASL